MSETRSRFAGSISPKTRLRWLRLALRFFGGSTVVLTGFLMAALVLDLSVVGEGSFLEWYFLWHPRNLAYELMVGAMLAAWGAFLWVAARDPVRHTFFLTFSIVFLGLHALVMAYAAAVVEGEFHHVLTDVAFLAFVAGVILVLYPRGTAAAD